MNTTQILKLLPYLTPEERKELDAILAADTAIWRPLPGPQSLAYHSTATYIGYGGAAGGGKGLALDTPLSTPGGWIPIGDVAAGDTLFDEQGRACRVVAVSDVQHRPCYRLTFDDGSVLVADDVHRWVTFDNRELAQLTRSDPEWRAARRAKRPSRATGNRSPAFTASLAQRNAHRAENLEFAIPAGTLRDTTELAHTLRTPTGRTNHAIRVASLLDLPTTDLPISPYTLGAWLGDGASRNGQITSIDPEIWQRIELDGFEVRHYARDVKQHNIIGLKVRLRDLGVLENKHIPPMYLRASFEQRLALLQGLMDTDGYAAPDGGCEFDGVRQPLVEGVLELVRSLGIKATKQQGTAKLNGRVIGDKWRVKFITSLPVFYLPRKRARLKSTTRRTIGFRYLVNCEPVDSVPTRCIAVDSPSRQYLAGRSMIPTHNTDLACGKAITHHQKIMMLRRVGTELVGIEDRLAELFGSTDGYNSQKGIWRPRLLPGQRKRLQIELNSVPNLGDERKLQGRPHDLVCFDEVTNFLEIQVRFLLGWLRSVDPKQQCQALFTFNPPTSAEGRWIIPFFAPWLDPNHLCPAEPGELRWFATLSERGTSRDVELPDGRPFVWVDGRTVYDFDPKGFRPEDIVTPHTRTFIPSRVSDNPYLYGTGYMTTLQALPEPLRSQMLYGDFQAGMEDDAMQVIPTDWVAAAMARWKPMDRKPPMDSLGVDVARGGKDNTLIARRHGPWFDAPLVYPGKQTPDGPTVAGVVISAKRDDAPIHIDVIGVGASPYDFLNQAGQHVLGVNVAESPLGMDKSGRLHFTNLRSELWWRMREALDPANNTGIALPPVAELRADLCAPTWRLQGKMVYVEGRDDLIKRLGRSPDYASAYLLALMDTPKIVQRAAGNLLRREYDPYRR